MIKPKPSFKKCPSCGKMFLYAPKSDCLGARDFICKKCKGEKEGIIESIVTIFKNIKRA